ncbi:unnamed protein product, partial [Oppiella nova]
MQCLKGLAQKHDISIIASIHQPNTDVLHLCDRLYVLSKGGHCVYWGPPDKLPQHLNSCGITCDEDQVPIETLITIASKGMSDPVVHELRAKTTSRAKQEVQEVFSQTDVALIQHKKKWFSFQDIYLLLCRQSTEVYSYRWRQISAKTVLFIGISLAFSLSVNSSVGRYDDCVSLTTSLSAGNDTSCLQMADRDFMVDQNVNYLLNTLWTFAVLQSVVTVSEKIIALKIMANEHQNMWYSSGVYFVTETLADLVSVTMNAGASAAILFFVSNQPNELGGNRRFLNYMLAFQLNLHGFDAFAHLVSIIFYKYKSMCFMIDLVYTIITGVINNVFMDLHTMPAFVRKLSDLSVFKLTTDAVMIAIYGMDRCPTNWFSQSLFRSHIKNKVSVRNTVDTIMSPDVDCPTESAPVLSIAWIDMTLKSRQTLFSSEKLILRRIKGVVEFGSMTALMGPSGAGKTSLLKALNGMNSRLMTKESAIHLNVETGVRTCFIAQDQREHLMSGLSVKQALIYASKLKNGSFEGRVDHESNVWQLMDELAISDISAINVEKCSSGQQKRIVMAMEMTAQLKPNLICVDEPTSGVDSYSALLMIQCFKRLSHRHRLSIITSIHQPNVEIIVLFNRLYILAKGGLTVYSGPPYGLRQHLSDCHILCTENQIPIEVLMKIAAIGVDNEAVIDMSDKTTKEMQEYDDMIATQLKHFPKGIPIQRKGMSFGECWHLMGRALTNTLRSNWKFIGVQVIAYVSLGGFFRALYDEPLDRAVGCQPLTAGHCDLSAKAIEDTK